jgi:hypothetical protein
MKFKLSIEAWGFIGLSGNQIADCRVKIVTLFCKKKSVSNPAVTEFIIVCFY